MRSSRRSGSSATPASSLESALRRLALTIFRAELDRLRATPLRPTIDASRSGVRSTPARPDAAIAGTVTRSAAATRRSAATGRVEARMQPSAAIATNGPKSPNGENSTAVAAMSDSCAIVDPPNMAAESLAARVEVRTLADDDAAPLAAEVNGVAPSTPTVSMATLQVTPTTGVQPLATSSAESLRRVDQQRSAASEQRRERMQRRREEREQRRRQRLDRARQRRAAATAGVGPNHLP